MADSVARKAKAQAGWALVRRAAIGPERSTAFTRSKNPFDRNVVRHGIFSAGPRIMPPRGFTITSVGVDSVDKALWIVDEESAKLWSGAAFEDVDHPQPGTFSKNTGTTFVFPDKARQMISVPRSHSWVTWGPKQPLLRLYDQHWQEISHIEVPADIYHACINPYVPGMVVAGGWGEVYIFSIRFEKQIVLLRTLKVSLEHPFLSPFSVLSLAEPANLEQNACFCCDDALVLHKIAGSLVKVNRQCGHDGSISACHYYDPLQLIITAATDVKVWSTDLELQYTFLGHEKSVVAIARHPAPNLIMTASADQTVRVWNLVSFDSVYMINTMETLLGIATLGHKQRFFTYSEERLNVWEINHIHGDFSLFSKPVANLSYVESFNNPARIVAVEGEQSCRLLSPSNGSVLTEVASLSEVLQQEGLGSEDSAVSIADATYTTALERLFLCTSKGQVLMFDASHKPCTFMDYMRGVDSELTPCTCLCLVTQCLSSTGQRHSWTPLMHHVVTGNTVVQLFAGTQRGTVITFDYSLGLVRCETTVNHDAPIVALLANSSESKLVSYCRNGTVRSWQINTSTGGDLTPLSTFNPVEPPHFCTLVGNRLFMASNNVKHQEFTTSMLNIRTEETSSHSLTDDHKFEITSVSSSEFYGVFASASRDGVVKVWDHHCVLVRELHLQDEVIGCCFLSAQGNFMIAVKNQVHVVPFSDFLPRRFQTKERNAMIKEEENEASSPLDQAALAKKEEGEVTLSVRDRELAEYLRTREAYQSEDPNVDRPHKVSLPTLLEFVDKQFPKNKEAESVRRHYAALPAGSFDRDLRTLQKQLANFPDSQSGQSETLDMQLRALLFSSGLPQPPIAPDGSVPNSIVWKWLLKYGGAQEEVEPARWQPKTISADQLEASAFELQDNSMMHMLDDEEEEEKPPTSESEPESEFDWDRNVPSRDLRKLSARQRKESSAEPEPEPEHQRTPTPSPPPTPPQATPPSSAPASSPPTPPVSPPKTPPPQLPALPRFITQFRDSDWFQHYYPNAKPATFDHVREFDSEGTPQQITLFAFVNLLASLTSGLLHSTQAWALLAGILEALLLLAQQDGFTFEDLVGTSLLKFIKEQQPRHADLEQRPSLSQSILLWRELKDRSEASVVEWLVYYLEADSKLSTLIREVFHELGLIDRRALLWKHVDTWKSTGGEAPVKRRKRYHDTVEDFVGHWRRDMLLERPETKEPSGIDVLNYWVEVETETERRRKKPSAEVEVEEEDDDPSRLALPNIRTGRSVGRIGYVRPAQPKSLGSLPDIDKSRFGLLHLRPQQFELSSPKGQKAVKPGGFRKGSSSNLFMMSKTWTKQ